MFSDTMELRESMMKDLQELRDGKINNAAANARARLSRAIVSTVALEIAAAQLGKHFDAVPLRRSGAKLKTVA